MKVRIRRLDPAVPLPEYQTRGSVGFDIAANEEVTIEPRALRLVKTGLVVEVPAGYFLAILARSSTPLRKGLLLANAVGIIDADYSGPSDEIMLELLNFTDRPVVVNRGERLAQGLVIPVVRVEWQDSAELGEESRGGFGATGH